MTDQESNPPSAETLARRIREIEQADARAQEARQEYDILRCAVEAAIDALRGKGRPDRVGADVALRILEGTKPA